MEMSDIVILNELQNNSSSLNNNLLSLDSDFMQNINYKNPIINSLITIDNLKSISNKNNLELETLKNNNKTIKELIIDMRNEYNMIKFDIDYLNKTYNDIISLFIDISKKSV
jgi:hypothetical protein